MKRQFSFYVFLSMLLLLAACSSPVEEQLSDDLSGLDSAATSTPAIQPTWTPTEEVAAPTRLAVATPTEMATKMATAEPTQTATAEPTLTPTATSTIVPDPPTPTSIDELVVVFTRDNNAWLWTETGGERQLTKNGGVDQVLLSDDRQIIAFRRGNGLWAVNADGSDERQLVNERDLPIPQDGALAGGVTDMTVYRVDWIPDSHQLLFNTSPQIEGPGLFLSDDLWWVDADSQTLVNMFAPSEGGQFTISPDGRRVALVTPESISVAGLEGQDKERVFSYTPVSTYSEVQYYARPVWSPEGDNLAVVIPPPDPLAAEINAYGVWIMAANGESARLNGSLEIQGRGLFEPSISPTLETIAYPSSPEVEPERTDLLLVSWEDTIGDPMFYASQVGSFYDWSPGGERFSFTRPPGETAAFSIFTGQMDEEPQLVGNGESLTRNVHWVDDNSYLYLQASDRGWELLLSDSSGAVTLIASVGGQSPRFDAVR